ncbi:hypothetical protein HMN09_00661800 [Mycena chlorophos]|uniref:DUF829-domain-containing protein n=1 Tax=Mycena chlorophos TaxID=658473 RepID=A0A8H6T1E1_MYCCL|nr:hypothetical protein HMN09_00661800 [Mycena chlorophos]
MAHSVVLTQLSSLVYVGNRSAAAPPSTTSPSLVILFGYMDATMKHLQKYVDGMHALFPAAEILLLHSHPNWLYSTNKYIESQLAPAVEILQAHASARRKQNAGILLHIMSNGGAFNYMSLHVLLSKTLASPHTLPSTTPIAIILDSAPGKDGRLAAVGSFAGPPPAHGLSILRMIAVPTISLGYYLLAALSSAAGNEEWFTQMRRTLLARSVLPGIVESPADSDAKTRRLFIYSKLDHVNPPSFVESHIAEARKCRIEVDEGRYEDTMHVGHAHKYPERYWDSVRKFWERAAKSAGLERALL